RRVLFVLAVVLATAIMWAADHALGARIGRAALRELAGFATTAALVLSLLVLRRPLWALIDRLVFRRRHSRRTELQAILHTLSPELGAPEWCRRAAEASRDILRLRGVAVLLTRGRGDVMVGELDAASLRAAWGDGSIAAALPSHSFAFGTVREL